MSPIIDISPYLKSLDVLENDILIFTNAGEEVEKDFSKTKDGKGLKKVFEIGIQLPNGREKIATPNKTSLRGLVADLGNDTEKWIGKKVQVNFVNQLAFGKMTKVLMLMAVK